VVKVETCAFLHVKGTGTQVTLATAAADRPTKQQASLVHFQLQPKQPARPRTTAQQHTATRRHTQRVHQSPAAQQSQSGRQQSTKGPQRVEGAPWCLCGAPCSLRGWGRHRHPPMMPRLGEGGGEDRGARGSGISTVVVRGWCGALKPGCLLETQL